MSRGVKTGLDYFPLDCDMFEDEKVELVSAKYGILSELIIIKLLTRIYRNGYFLDWNDDRAYLFAKKFGDGITKELLCNIINELHNNNFLNVRLYENYGILTSRGIQRRYLYATKRRISIDIYKEFLLLEIKDVFILNKNVNIIALDVDIYPQSKGNGAKVKNIWSNAEKCNINQEKCNINAEKCNINTEKCNIDKFSDDSTEITLSKLLFSMIQKRNNENKPPNFQKWAEEIRKMIEIDKRDPIKIRSVIEWSQKHDVQNEKGFCWANIILSTKKLREQYDQLTLKMYGNSGSKKELIKKSRWQNIGEPKI